MMEPSLGGTLGKECSLDMVVVSLVIVILLKTLALLLTLGRIIHGHTTELYLTPLHLDTQSV